MCMLPLLAPSHLVHILVSRTLPQLPFISTVALFIGISSCMSFLLASLWLHHDQPLYRAELSLLVFIHLVQPVLFLMFCTFRSLVNVLIAYRSFFLHCWSMWVLVSCHWLMYSSFTFRFWCLHLGFSLIFIIPWYNLSCSSLSMPLGPRLMLWSFSEVFFYPVGPCGSWFVPISISLLHSALIMLKLYKIFNTLTLKECPITTASVPRQFQWAVSNNNNL